MSTKKCLKTQVEQNCLTKNNLQPTFCMVVGNKRHNAGNEVKLAKQHNNAMSTITRIRAGEQGNEGRVEQHKYGSPTSYIQCAPCTMGLHMRSHAHLVQVPEEKERRAASLIERSIVKLHCSLPYSFLAQETT